MGTPWWNDTNFILLRGESGAILYGEITFNKDILNVEHVKEGDLLGWVKTVLKEDKGKPMTMLHIELYNENYIGDGVIWKLGEQKPEILRDITSLLRVGLFKRKYKPPVAYHITDRDRTQPREVSAGYFIDAEEMKDFIDYLFDVEEIGDYNELWKRFKEYEENEH